MKKYKNGYEYGTVSQGCCVSVNILLFKFISTPLYFL